MVSQAMLNCEDPRRTEQISLELTLLGFVFWICWLWPRLTPYFPPFPHPQSYDVGNLYHRIPRLDPFCLSAKCFLTISQNLFPFHRPALTLCHATFASFSSPTITHFQLLIFFSQFQNTPRKWKTEEDRPLFILLLPSLSQALCLGEIQS